MASFATIASALVAAAPAQAAWAAGTSGCQAGGNAMNTGVLVAAVIMLFMMRRP